MRMHLPQWANFFCKVRLDACIENENAIINPPSLGKTVILSSDEQHLYAP